MEDYEESMSDGDVDSIELPPMPSLISIKKNKYLRGTSCENETHSATPLSKTHVSGVDRHTYLALNAGQPEEAHLPTRRSYHQIPKSVQATSMIQGQYPTPKQASQTVLYWL